MYESVFEPLTDAFAGHALDDLSLAQGARLLDIAAGSGGAAVMAAARGLSVTAVDASHGMVARIAARAATTASGGTLTARQMDGTALAFADASFDAAMSVFGVILFPEPLAGLREAFRVLKAGAPLALVTWTDPEKYELAARLIGAAAEVLGEAPRPPSLPAQLRFRDEAAFRGLFRDAGFGRETVKKYDVSWPLPSARWIAERIAFAPGMAAMTGAFGENRDRILQAFVARLEAERGTGPISLSATAFVGVGWKP